MVAYKLYLRSISYIFCVNAAVSNFLASAEDLSHYIIWKWHCIGKNSILLWINFSKHNGNTTTQKHKDLHANLFSLKEKPQDKLQIISLYQIEITTLRDTTWVKKISLFLFTYCSLPRCIFSLPLSIFLFSLACSHSRSSTRLHFSPQSHLWDFSLFTFLQMAE